MVEFKIKTGNASFEENLEGEAKHIASQIEECLLGQRKSIFDLNGNKIGEMRGEI